MTDLTQTVIEDGNTTQTEDTKTFSQDDVNRIVQERLAKEKSKLETSMAEKEKDLARREFELAAVDVFKNKKMPEESHKVLLENLNHGGDVQQLENCIKAVYDCFVSVVRKTNSLTGPGPVINGFTPSLPSQDKIIRDAMGLNGS